jgi:hypothetical protein
MRAAACLDAERISQTSRNIAAISGPKTIPFIPKISMPLGASQKLDRFS